LLIQLEQSQQTVRELKKGIEELAQSIRAEELKDEVASLEEQVNQPDFWSDTQKSQAVLKNLKSKKRMLDNYLALKRI
jgi:peptide chain release factor 2